MTLTDPQMLIDYMAQREINGSRLGLKSGVSRQFIYQLRLGRRRKCSEDIATRIEGALGLLPGTIFREENAARPLVGAGQTTAA